VHGVKKFFARRTFLRARKNFSQNLLNAPGVVASECATPMNAALLQNQIDALTQQIGSLQQALEASRIENNLLRQKLDALARRLFGKQSEQLDAAQLQLLLSGLAQLDFQSAAQSSTLAVASAPRQPSTPSHAG
jgi:septal ring factor EnvC (AmiA/AmiB activator)